MTRGPRQPEFSATVVQSSAEVPCMGMNIHLCHVTSTSNAIRSFGKAFLSRWIQDNHLKSIISQRHVPILLRTAIVAFVIKLWLVSDTRIISTFAPIDASNFVEHAKSIATGKWFGTYDQFTLIKVPMLALTLAAMREFGIPTLLGFSVGFTLACYAACIAICPIVRDERTLAVIFIGMYFNPMSFGTQEWLMQRGFLTSIFATIVAASCIGIVVRTTRSRSELVPWFCGLGCSATALFLTREEAIWIAPLVLISLGAFAWRAYNMARESFVARVALVMIPIGIAIASYTTILGLNQAYYGWATVTELQAPEFISAYNSLTRIVAPGTERKVPATRAALQLAYRVSPAASELRTWLDGSLGGGWAKASCQFVNVCTGEIAGGWFMWALRDSAALAGHYTSGPDARAFYKRVASEVDGACDRGDIPCRRKGNTLLAAISFADAPVIAQQFVHAWALVLGYRQRLVLPFDAVGLQSVQHDYEFVTGMTELRESGMIYSGWLMRRQTRGIDVVAADGTPQADAVLTFHRSDDVLRAYPSYREYDQDMARFDVTTTCTTCSLAVKMADGQSLEIPLAASTVDFKKPGVLYHLDIAKSLNIVAADAPLKYWLLGEIGDCYGALVPTLAIIAMLAVAFRMVRTASGSRAVGFEHVLFAGGFVASASLLLVGLSVIDAFLFNAFFSEYMGGLFPLLPLAIGFVGAVEVHALARTIRAPGFATQLGTEFKAARYVGARFALERAGAVNTTVKVSLGVIIIVAFVLAIAAKTLLEPLTKAPATAESWTAHAPALAPRDVSALCANVENVVSSQGNGFADEFTDVSGKTLTGVISRNGEIAVRGWAVDRDAKFDATAACLFVDGKPEPQATSIVGMARADIVAAFKNDKLADSGYVIRVSARRLGIGHHVVTVAERFTDGTFARLNGSFNITVR